MGTITIQFQGICVNFRQAFHPDLPIAHRVVLLNVSRGATLGGDVIPPHFGLLTGTSNPMPLTGVTLRVLDPAVIGCTYAPSYTDLPNLTNLIASQGEVLGPPSLPVLLGADPDLVAAYFDFDSGFFTACTDNGAAGVTVVVTTTPIEGKVRLQITPFTTYVATPVAPWTLEFDNGTTLTVQLVSPEEGMTTDGLTHFNLSYLTADRLPPVLVTPTTGPGDCLTLRGIAGPGCSDSNYP